MNKYTSIRKRLVISLIVLSVTPLLLLGTLLTWQSFVIQQKQAGDLQSESSKRALNQIQAMINELQSELQLLTKTQRLLELNYEQQYNILSIYRSHKTKSRKEILNEIELLDGNGLQKVRISRSSVITQDDLISKVSYPEFTIPSSSGEAYYGPVGFNDETSEPYMIIGMPIISLSNNKVEGVIVVSVRLKFMRDLIAEVPIGESGVAYLTDSGGKVIVHPNPSVVLRGSYVKIPAKPGIRKGLNGKRSVTASEQIQIGSQTLHIVTELPVSEALEHTYFSTATIVSFLLLTLAGIIALGFVIVRRIVQPIEILSKTAGSISSGDLTQKAPVSGNDEISVLADSFNTMTSKLVETIDSVKQSHERLVLVLDSLDSIVYVSDLKTNEILFINRYTRDIFGDIEGKICWEGLQSGQSGPCTFCSNDKLLNSDGTPAGIYKWEFRNTTNNRWYYIHDRAIYWVDGRLVRIEIATDITERKMAQAALLQEKKRLEEVTSHINCGLFLLDDKGRVTYANSVAQEWFGPFEHIEGEYFWKVSKIEDQEKNCSSLKVLQTGKTSQSEITIKTETGEEKVLFEISSPVKDKKGRIYQITALIIDITKRKKAEEKIRASLSEKEVLLKEIHHRVKNNMQVISSLLNLQSEYIDEKQYIDMFHDSRNRIRSMALVHEKLYQSSDLSNINFNDYIKSLTNGLITFYGISPNSISTKIEIEGINLSIDTAIPCGLIINELLSNALKYAFPDGETGVIKIMFNETTINGNDGYELKIMDNGIGIPDNIDIRKTRSLGLQLVTNLVEHQLQGKIELNRDNGAAFYIRFGKLGYTTRI